MSARAAFARSLLLVGAILSVATSRNPPQGTARGSRTGLAPDVLHTSTMDVVVTGDGHVSAYVELSVYSDQPDTTVRLIDVDSGSELGAAVGNGGRIHAPLPLCTDALSCSRTYAIEVEVRGTSPARLDWNADFYLDSVPGPGAPPLVVRLVVACLSACIGAEDADAEPIVATITVR